MSKSGAKQPPKSDLHERLGLELRRIRLNAGKTTREIGSFSTTHVSRVENGLADCSEELIEEYVKLGGDRVRLMSMLDDLRRAVLEKRRRQRQADVSEIDEAALNLTADSDFHELRRLYRTEEHDDHYMIGPDKATLRATHIIRLRPLTPTARYFVTMYGSGENNRTGVLSLSPGQGCTVARCDETSRGALHFVLDFKPENSGPTEALREFTFSIAFQDDAPMLVRPMLRNSTRSGIRRVVKRVQFTEPALPKRIWWFRAVELLETEAEPEPNQLLELNPSNFYFCEFTDLVDEYVGLAWEWA